MMTPEVGYNLLDGGAGCCNLIARADCVIRVGKVVVAMVSSVTRLTVTTITRPDVV